MKDFTPIAVFLICSAIIGYAAANLTYVTNNTSDERQGSAIEENVPPSETKLEFRLEGGLPDIGKFDGTPDRFYEEYTPDFIPSEEYGRIIPYTGSYKIFTSNDFGQETRIGYSSYGFCTEDGRIVMDASDRNTGIYYTKTNDGFGFYRLTITDDYGTEELDDIYMPQRSFIIPESGKWCIELDKNSWISEAKNGIILVMSYIDDSGRGECILYDYEGNELSRIGEYDNVNLCDNGLILVMRWDADDPFHGFLDMDGNVVLGPYVSANPFSSFGIANVETTEGCHLIDQDGNILTKQPYSNINLHKKDYDLDKPSLYVARRSDNHYISDIYSPDGKFLTTIRGSAYFSVRFPENGEAIYYYTNKYDDSMTWKYLSDDSEFKSIECGRSPNSYSGNDDIYLYEDEATGTGYIFNSKGETIITVENFLDLNSISEDNRYILYSTGNYEDYYDEISKQNRTRANRTTYLYDTVVKKNILLPIQSSEYNSNFVSNANNYLIVCSYSDLSYFGDSGSYSLYDIKNDKLLYENSSSITYSNIGGKDYFTVCKKNVCSLYDGEMNTIIKIYND